MIETKKYSTIMSQILKEGTCQGYKIAKSKVPMGHVLRTYDPRRGRLYEDVFDSDFRIVTLKCKDDIWMSDTPLEQESYKPAVEKARGNVLICGLGIGLLPTFIKDKPEVKHIDIVEISKCVIKLVWEQIRTPKMEIIHGDAWKYLAKSPKKYDFIHVDIWGSITAPILEVRKAREAALNCLKPNGDVHCWLQELYDRIISKLPKTANFPTSTAGLHEPCLICGKTIRNDYAGLCMDCADGIGLSELFMETQT